MSVLSVFLMLAIGGGVLLGLWAVVAFISPASRDARRLTRENKAMRELIFRIDKLAYNNRDVNPELSIQVIDEIATYKNREIES